MNRLIRASLFVALATACPLLGAPLQPPATSPPPATTDAPKKPAHEFPFTLRAGKVFIDVKVNDHGPYPFIIDTDLCKDLGLRPTPLGSVGGAGEGSTPSAGVEAVTLEFGGITLDHPALIGVAINRRLKGFSGTEIRGLIGNDWVSRNVVEIDYAKRVVRVRDPKDWEYTGNGAIIRTRTRGYTYVQSQITLPPGARPVPDLEPIKDDADHLDIRNSDEPIRVTFAIDTGAGLSATLNTSLVNRHHLLNLKTPMVETIVGYGLGGEVKHRVCRMQSLTIGAVTIEHPIVTLSQDKAGALSNTTFEGIIGADILTRFTVIFDATRKRMILEKNAAFEAPMEFDMSGLVLAGDGEGNRLRVMYLVPDSPAAKAGIQLSDLVLTVDGKKVTASDRDHVRELMRHDGEQRTLELKRGDETVKATFTLKRMV